MPTNSDTLEETPDTVLDENPITKDEIEESWGVGVFGGDPHYLSYLVDILNGEYDLETAREDIKSFRKPAPNQLNKEE